ncbi:MAG TPA: phosphotyrosine protein phosphatase [Pilimelia sp.]|nr:phosphotyrosine protein phosphatase [Pilimelia sp.]
MPPFVVLHVCMGNICRSPMAERLLALAVRRRVRDLGWPLDPTDLVYSHGAGTGGWHVGQPMNTPAARELRDRGADPVGFAARKLRGDQLDASDLVLTATAEQADYVAELRPDAADRTFVLGELGRLLPVVAAAALPAAGPDPKLVYARGAALVEAARAARGAGPLPSDDLVDPYGLADAAFTRVADEIAATVNPLAALLLPPG